MSFNNKKADYIKNIDIYIRTISRQDHIIKRKVQRFIQVDKQVNYKFHPQVTLHSVVCNRI